jgi:outer membrane protein
MTSSEKSLQAVERGYRLGVQTLVDVLNAREDVFRARNEFAKARYVLLREWSRLNLLAGTPADAQVSDMSALLNQPGLTSP